MKIYLLVSVIFLGIPLLRTGTIGATAFFTFDRASEDFCNSSALKAALLGFLFNVKCLTGLGCCPTYNNNIKNTT